MERTATNAQYWMIEAGTKIHQISSNSPYTISVTSPFPYTLGGGVGKHYTFTVTSASATVGATYTNNSQTFTVLATIASETTLYMGGTGAPAASGTLTKSTGTGDATIAFSAAAVHASPVGEDIITFNISGTEYVLYSYNDATDGDVGRITVVANNSYTAADFNDAWFSSATGGALLNKSVPHPMIIGDDQKLYIADLASSGTLSKLWQVSDTGTITSYTTVVPRNYAIRAFAKTGLQLIIFANKIKGSSSGVNEKGDAIAIFWDGSSQDPDIIYNLNDNEVTAGFNFGGIIGCFTTGRSNEFASIGYRSKLQIFEGGRFIPKFNFSQSTPGYGGFDIVNNMLCWNSGGVVYSYGSPYPELPVRVNSINIGASTSNGFLKSLNGLEIYLSTGSAGNNEVFKQAATHYASAAWKGLNAEPIFPEGKRGKVEQIEVCFYEAASSGRAITLTLDTNFGTTHTILDALLTVTAGKNIIYRRVNSTSGTLPFFNVLKPTVQYATGSGSGISPIIRYIKIYFSHQNIVY